MNAPKRQNTYFLLLMIGWAFLGIILVASGFMVTLVSYLLAEVAGPGDAFPFPMEHYRIAGAINGVCGLIGLASAFGLYKRKRWGAMTSKINAVLLWLNGTLFAGHLAVYTPSDPTPALIALQMKLMSALMIVMVMAIFGGIFWLSRKESVLSELS